MDEKEIKGRASNDRLDPYLAGTEPVLLLAAVEQDLEDANGHTQRAEAKPIELLSRVARRVPQKDGHAEKSENADRQVDIEYVPPAVILGQPAAEDRAENGTGHHPQAK